MEAEGGKGAKSRHPILVKKVFCWSKVLACRGGINGMPFWDSIPRHHHTQTSCLSGPLNYNQGLTLSSAACRVIIQASLPSLSVYFIIHKVGIERKP
jgi:hypothetical protein